MRERIQQLSKMAENLLVGLQALERDLPRHDGQLADSVKEARSYARCCSEEVDHALRLTTDVPREPEQKRRRR